MPHIFARLLLLWVIALPTAAYEGELQSGEVNGIEIAYMDLGDRQAPVAVMIMGLGGSHVLWGQDIVDRLLAQGYRVLLFDNRDTGGSQRFDQYSRVMWWQFLKAQLGFDVNEVYTLRDMAGDTVALMDALQIESGHIVGISMGGMIAQELAAHWPERTASLVSIMSTPGAAHLPPPTDAALESLRSTAAGEGDIDALHARGMYPEAMERQMLAIFDAGDRSDSVRTITAPTLVLHGKDDQLVPVEHGEYTAELISGARFVAFDDMNHSLPPDVLPAIVDEMVTHMRRVDAQQGLH